MDNISTITTLESYKKLTEIQSNQAQLLKEKTIILYVATLLECKNKQVLTLCLDILENFIRNEQSHYTLMTTFGIFEALESLSIKLRHSSLSSLSQRAAEITDLLRNSAPPSYGTRNRSKRRISKTTFVYLLHIEELTQNNRSQLDEALIQIKGIISFVVDLEHKRCTIRIGAKLPLKSLITKINSACGMTPFVVSRSVDKNETLINILEDDQSTSLEYVPEVDSSVQGRQVKMVGNSEIGTSTTSNGLVKTITNFWNKNFYW